MRKLALVCLAWIAAVLPASAQYYFPPTTGGGGGGGGVSSVSTGCGLTGGTITTSGTVRSSFTLDSQTGSGAFAIPNGDCGRIVYQNQALAVSDTLAQAGAGGNFASGWWTMYQCAGAGGCTITPTTSTIDGAASLVLIQNQGVMLFSDGANYFTQRGVGSSSSGLAYSGSPTANAILVGVDSGHIKVANTLVTIDGAGNVSIPGSFTTGGAGVGGFMNFGQGTTPPFPGTGFIQLRAPNTVSSPYSWILPAQDSAGTILSDGFGNLSILGYVGTGNAVRAISPAFTGTVTMANLTMSGSMVLSSLGGGGTLCLHVDNTGAIGVAAFDCGSGGGGGSGTVTHTAGPLNSGFVTIGNTAADIKITGVSIDGSNNISTPGNIAVGVGGSAAGYSEFGQGTPPSITSTAAQIVAPATVSTGYQIILPGAPPTGLAILKLSNSAGVVTASFLAASGSGTNCFLDNATFGSCPAGPVTVNTASAGNIAYYSGSSAISGNSLSFATLTDGATISWNISSAPFANAQVTLGGNRTINVSNLVNGGSYVLAIIQDGTGSRTLALGTGCTWKVNGGGAGAITLTTAAGSRDVLAFTYDGTVCYANIGTNYN